MSASMIEKVAEAIYNKFKEMNEDKDVPTWKELEPEGKQIGYDLAKITLEAMKEPTEGMKNCSEEIHWGYNCNICGGLKDGWNKMFEAALNGK